MNIPFDTDKPNLHVVGFIRLKAAPESSTTHEPEFEVLSRRVKPATEGVREIQLEKHPIDMKLRTDKPLQEIPIKLFFDKAENAITVRYVGYSADGATKCEGNGVTANMTKNDGQQEPITLQHDCHGCVGCSVAEQHGLTCRAQVRMPVKIDGHQNGASGVFEVRSSSYYTWRGLVAQLANMERMFGGLLHVPLKLKIWQMSNRASGYADFDLIELDLNAEDDLAAMQLAKNARDDRKAVGIADNPDDVFAGWARADNSGLDEMADFYAPSTALQRMAHRDKAKASTTTIGFDAIKSAVAKAKESVIREVEAVEN
jgi:hypothetical protein